MNIIYKLTLKHLRMNFSRTLITLLGIMLSVAMVAAVTGYVYSFHDYSYRSILERRGPYHLAFCEINMETAKMIVAESVFESNHEIVESRNGEAGTYDAYVRFDKSIKKPDKHIEELQFNYDVMSMSYNAELMALEGFDVGDSSMMTVSILASILIVIIAASSIIVIANSFSISTSERVKQFGLLKSIGATAKQIGRSVIFEALILSLIAIPLGILLGFAVQTASLAIINKVFFNAGIYARNPISLRWVFNWLILIITAIVSFVTVLLSALRPAVRAAKTPAIDSLRQSKQIRIRRKELKVSAITQKLFGVEGVLAAKTLKRNKGKQRAAVIALAVSVILFVAVSSFVNMLNQSIRAVYGISEHNVLLSAYGNLKRQEEIIDYFAENNDYQYTIQRTIVVYPHLPKEFFTSEYYVWLKDKHNTASTVFDSKLIAIPDAEFEKLAPGVGIEFSGLLINTTGVTFYKGKSRSFTPFVMALAQRIDVELYKEEIGAIDTVADDILTLTLTLVAEITTLPESFPSNYWEGAANILIAESTYNKIALLCGDMSYAIRLKAFINTKDPQKLTEELRELFPKSPEQGAVYVSNLAEEERGQRSVAFVAALFGYGFITMLSLIAVTSVIATISTGMALRKQEFAMLQSMGMTNSGTAKMLNLEGLLYGTKSLAIGLPLGVAVSYLLYRGFQRSMAFAYSLPLLSIIIAMVMVFLLTFLTMYYGRRKIRKINIIETIRNEML